MTPSASAMTYVVLGLVVRHPGSGYDIDAFAERSIRNFWPISRSQLYAELSRLEELGWAQGTAVQQDKYPNKRVYEATPAGVTVLREWLDDSSPKQRPRTHDPIVLKTFFGPHMSPDRLLEQVRQYRVQAEELRAKTLATIARLERMGPVGTHRFGLITARSGVLQAEATIAWTKEVEAFLDSPRDPDAS